MSTFGKGDGEKILRAMRGLPYDTLVLVGERGIDECEDLVGLRRLEDMAGHEVTVETIHDNTFLGSVDSLGDVLSRYTHSRDDTVKLNISGGSKLLGDAALLAAFRLGVETYHVDARVVRLPVLKGATAKDRFTDSQVKLIQTIGLDDIRLDALVKKMGQTSRQSVDRIIREVRNLGLLRAEAKDRMIILSLTPTGREVYNALKAVNGS